MSVLSLPPGWNTTASSTGPAGDRPGLCRSIAEVVWQTAPSSPVDLLHDRWYGRSAAINRTLAEAAQRRDRDGGWLAARGAGRPCGWPPASACDVAPDILLFANLGAIQLNYGYSLDHCQRAVEMTGADALILHLNCLQEALQPEGDTRFAGLLERIAQSAGRCPSRSSSKKSAGAFPARRLACW